MEFISVKYIGLDASTTATGVGILEDKELLHYTCIKPKSKDWEERVGLIAIELNNILSQYPDIECAYIEDIPLKDGKPTIKKLSCVRGAIKAVLAMNGITLIPRPVNDWRQDAGFFDGTKKGMTREEMKVKAIDEVKRLYNISVNDDTAEGILVALRSKYPIVKKSKFGKK